MAIYDGFFDASFDEESGEYDRTYNSGDFTGYFGQIIGSGVCIYGNPDSMKVHYQNQSRNAIISPGYLFIQGYWLKNDADALLVVNGTGIFAIAAKLNLGKRMIELSVIPKADPEIYPDTLILAYINTAAGTIEDTRYRTDICGVIDAVGSLSGKVQYALDYIDHQISDKLIQIESEIETQSDLLDNKIAEMQAQVDALIPPPVGTIKFSASQDVGPEWLRCDGSFINETDYPELVTALGKLIPSGDKFKLISDGEIGPQISNGAICFGRIWVYSCGAKTLYGVDINGTSPIKKIRITGEDTYFNNIVPPSGTSHILALSIVPVRSNPGKYKLCLAQFLFSQIKIENQVPDIQSDTFLLYWSDFTGSEEALTLKRPFSEVDFIYPEGQSYVSAFQSDHIIPYVISRLESGVDKFYCLAGDYKNYGYEFLKIVWGTDSQNGKLCEFRAYEPGKYANHVNPLFQGYHKKNLDEFVILGERSVDGTLSVMRHNLIVSVESGTFNRAASSDGESSTIFGVDTNLTTVSIMGSDVCLLKISADTKRIHTIKRSENSLAKSVDINLPAIPPAKRVFPDAAAYLWGKDMFFIFVGTGILFSRDLTPDSFGYLDTTSILGTITQYGYLDYSQDEGTLYILGQDTANKIKVAKIVLNTLYDYANDGAWLPLIASDGVPAYIKAKEPEAVS